MLFRIYRRLIGEKLFAKVIIIYTIIIILALVALTSVVLQNYNSSAHVNAINYSAQIVQDVSKYFDQKISYVKQIQQLPYYREEIYGNVLFLLDEEYEMYSSDYISKKNTLNQYFRYACDLDSNILEVHSYSVKTETIFKYDAGKHISEVVTDLNMDAVSLPAIKKLFSPMLIPANQLSLPGNGSAEDSTVTIAANLRSQDLSKIVGSIFLTFDLHELEEIIAKVERKFNYELIIYDLDGMVLYDPYKIVTKSSYPGFDKIKNTQTDLMIEGNCITSILKDEEAGIISACIIEDSQVSESTVTARKITIIIMILCILFALALSYICMSFFSKRIHMVCNAMRNVQTSNFRQRIKVGNSNDEISLIATNFNLMCDNLEEHIAKVYQAGMKQKDAELKQKIAEQYALQSQVNPHFLYNTLEAIRMSANASGNTEVARMIYMLGALFRSSISQQMFINIRNEIEYCESYLALLHLRHGERLKYQFVIDDSIYQFGMIKHLLQPIVENFIIHGIDPDKIENHIEVRGFQVNDTIEFHIEDNGTGISEKELAELKSRIEKNIISDNGSIGIVNINQRIKLIYGEAYGIQINSIAGNGTHIIVRIPAKTLKELEQDVQSNVS